MTILTSIAYIPKPSTGKKNSLIKKILILCTTVLTLKILKNNTEVDISTAGERKKCRNKYR